MCVYPLFAGMGVEGLQVFLSNVSQTKLLWQIVAKLELDTLILWSAGIPYSTLNALSHIKGNVLQ